MVINREGGVDMGEKIGAPESDAATRPPDLRGEAQALQDIILRIIGRQKDGNESVRQGNAKWEALFSALNNSESEAAKEQLRDLIEEARDWAETEVEPGETKRARREIELAGVIESYRDGQLPTAKKEGGKNVRENLAGILRRGDWGNLFRKTKSGDQLVAFLSPSDEFLSIKKMNTVLGPTTTDLILAQRRKLVVGEMEKLGAEVLQQDYKTDMFRIPKKMKGQIAAEDLRAVTEKIDGEMKRFIVALAKGTGLADEIEKNGFNITFGVGEIEAGDKDGEGIVDAACRSLQAAKLTGENERGGEYSDEKVLGALTEIEILNKKIEADPFLVDEQGHSRLIFEQETISADILRDLRNGKFRVKQEEENIKKFELIKRYLKLLNINDVVKPFTADEVHGRAFAKRLSDKEKMAEQILKGDKDKEKILEKLTRDEKDANFVSRSMFYARASNLPNAEVVLIDALDVGVRLVQKEERALRQIIEEKKNKNLSDEQVLAMVKEARLKAGDEITKEMKDFRQVCAEVAREKIGLAGNEPVLGLVGGDELTLAFDRDKVGAGEVDNILFEIKKRLEGKTSIRAVKTVMSRAEKNDAAGAGEEEKVEGLLKAIKRAEQGNHIAKAVEAATRRLNFALESKQVEPDEMETALREWGWLFRVEGASLRAEPIVVETKGKGEIVIRTNAGAPKSIEKSWQWQRDLESLPDSLVFGTKSVKIEKKA